MRQYCYSVYFKLFRHFSRSFPLIVTPIMQCWQVAGISPWITFLSTVCPDLCGVYGCYTTTLEGIVETVSSLQYNAQDRNAGGTVDQNCGSRRSVVTTEYPMPNDTWTPCASPSMSSCS